MRLPHPSARLLGLALLTSLASVAFSAPSARSAEPAPGPDRTDKSSRPATEVSMTGEMPMFLVPSDVFRELSEEAEHHFRSASEELARGDREHAAADVRKGASFLKLEAARGHVEEAQRLKEEAARLNDFSHRLASAPTPPSSTELATAFARADTELARHHVDRLDADWREHDATSTAADILAARHELLAAREWRSQFASPTIVAGYKRASDLAARMLQPIGWAAAEVDSVRAFFGVELTDLDSGS